jgi:hypothetical protein
MNKPRYQSKTVTIAAGTYSAEYRATETIELDTAYDTVVGVAVHRIIDTAAANGNYKVMIATNNRVEHDPTHISSWSTSKDDGTNPNERFKDFNIDVRGAGNLQCTIVLPAQTLASAIQVEFVVKLIQDKKRTE